MSEQEIIALLKPRYKAYLEGIFRQIAPTQAAMEYRKQLLTSLLDRSQELNIRGIEDPDLIYKLAIEELGDLTASAREHLGQAERATQIKRKISVGAAIAIALIALLAIVYVIVGAATGLWHPTWLIVLGGIFAGVVLLMVFASLKFIKKQKYTLVRLMLVAAEAMVSIFVFLVLQLIFKIDGSWLTFLAMVGMIFGVDTAVAFLVGDKLRWIEFPIFVEVFCVMLYVILGIALDVLLGGPSIWHPGWLLCLAGVVVAAVEVIVFIAKKVGERKRDDSRKRAASNDKQDESYWTQWDD